MGTLSRKERQRLLERDIESEIYKHLLEYLDFNYENKLRTIIFDVFTSFLQTQKQIKETLECTKNEIWNVEDWNLFVTEEYEKHESGIWLKQIIKFLKLTEDSRLKRICSHLINYANKYSNDKKFFNLVGIKFNEELDVYKFVFVILCEYFDNFSEKEFNDLLEKNNLD